jgi:hypothetical protein
MKQNIFEYVVQCPSCQLVKWPTGQLQPLEVPMWKWDQIAINVVLSLPIAPSGQDSIWVIVDRLTKSVDFLPINITVSLEKLT